MTAPATTRRAGPFTGNGVTTSFPFTFKVFSSSDIAVVKASTAGVESTLALGSGYSVALNVDQDSSPGGNITYPVSGVPLAVGEKLTVIGALPYDQTADLPTGGNYRAGVVENALDRTVFQVQQLVEGLDRALALPTSSAGMATELPPAASRANKLLGFNASGEVTLFAPADGSAAALAISLASTTAGQGSAQVAIADTGGHFTGTTVEAALQQLGPASFISPWYITKDSPVLTSLRHSVSGSIVQQWQDGTPGTAIYFYRGLSIQTDSHSMQMGPATSGGSCDLMWQRSVANADSGGNRFNLTFDEALDRMLLSYATTTSGFPSFDSAMQLYGGIAPSLLFPGISAQFNQGVGVKQRAAGGFECRLIPTSSTVADIKQVGGSGTTFFSFRDGAMGVFGSAGTSRITLPAAATDAATTMALANAIRAALISFGWCA